MAGKGVTSNKRDNQLSPVVKWVGGKRQLLRDIEINLPPDIFSYYEPFIGGGAVLFHLQPPSAVINDTNSELVNLYRVIKAHPDGLIDDLKKHRNDKDYFYEIRGIDREKSAYAEMSDVERASRIIFLNKTCYNGLFRVNSSGEFNTPFGRYKKPNIVNERTIRAICDYFNNNDITILNTDFESALEGIERGAFVYFDPPYDPVSPSANFTGYTSGGFGREEQLRLKRVCDNLNDMGVRFLLSNSATGFIRDLYSDYHVTIVSASRAVNSKAGKRGSVEEVLVRNY